MWHRLLTWYFVRFSANLSKHRKLICETYMAGAKAEIQRRIMREPISSFGDLENKAQGEIKSLSNAVSDL